MSVLSSRALHLPTQSTDASEESATTQKPSDYTVLLLTLYFPILVPMKTTSCVWGLLGLLLLGSYLPASAAEFSRYASILERRPFGAMTTVPEVSTAPVVTLAVPPAFVKDLRMCAITESPAGVRVGFVNIRAKPPRPYYLYVGDSEDGIELVDADYLKEGALLRKDSEQFWLNMGGGDPAGATASQPTSRSRLRSPSTSKRIARPPGRDSSKGVSTPSSNSYAERRRRRLAEMRKRASESRKESEVDVEKRLQQYQMELIRKGLTPLPIPLTKETDDQLVREGVLPAVSSVE